MKIVIIGGGPAGLTASKSIAKKTPSADVQLIAPNDEFWFNIAAPRLLVDREEIDNTFFNLPLALKNRGQKFVKGFVQSISFDKKIVILDNKEEVNYDYLIIASGARAPSEAFKVYQSSDITRQALKDTFEDIKKSKNICIIGGGPTGVELSGEVAFTYKDKKVTLYTGEKQPLPMLDTYRGNAASSKLKVLGVEVINDVFVDYKKDGEKYVVTEKNGKSGEYDLVVPAFGVSPNSSYIHQTNYLDTKGFVKVDENLRVCENVYAFGDIVSGSSQSLMDLIYQQVAVLEAVLDKDINNNTGTQIKPYTPATSDTMVVPISEQGGVGVLKGWGIPNFLVRKIKSETFMINKASEYVS